MTYVSKRYCENGFLVSFLIACVALEFFACDKAHAEPITQFDDFIILGASGIDAGNAHTVASLVGFPDPTPAAFGYFNGRFSNGPVSTDYINDQLFGEFALASSLGGDNYAFGGASFVTDISAEPFGPLPVIIPDFLEQVDQYIDNGVKPDALHLLQFGGNDTTAFLLGLPAEDVTSQSGDAIRVGGQKLIDAGANFIVFSTLDNRGFIPAINGGDPSVPGALKPFFDDYNDAIISAYSDLAAANTGTEFFVFDNARVFDDIFANPEAFGLDSTTQFTTCLAEGAAPGCEGFISFDGFHYTTAVHEIVAREFLISINDQLSAPKLAASISESALLTFEDSLATRLEAHQSRPDPGHSKVFVQSYYHDIQRDQSDGFAFNGQGPTLFGGFLDSPTTTFHYGFTIGYSDFDYKSSGRLKSDSKIVNFTLGSGWKLPAVTLDVIAAYERQKIKDIERLIYDTNRQALSTTKGRAFGAAAQLKFNSLVPQPWSVEPVFKLFWAREKVKGTREVGPTSLNQAIEWGTVKAFRGTLGFRLSRGWNTGVGGWSIQSWLDAAAIFDFDKTGPEVTTRLADFGSFDRVTQVELGESRALLNGGVTFSSPGGVAFSLQAAARLGGEVRSYQVGGNISYRF